MKPIKIVHVQNSTKSAGSAALRLNNALREAHYDSSIISLKTDKTPLNHIQYLGRNARVISWLDQRLKFFMDKKNIPEFGSYTFPVLGYDISKLEAIKEADIIYLHWILGGFLNLHSMKALFKLKKPIIIFMHDMWWMTGGCHYSFDCNKYLSGCYNCQNLAGSKKKDRSTLLFNKKQKLFSKYKNIHFVSPSIWLHNCGTNSSLLKNKPRYYIPNTIDDFHYKPIDKITARKIFDIAPDERVISFGAVKINSPYKGWSYLIDALHILKSKEVFKNITVLIFGSRPTRELENAIPFKTKFLGYLHDEYSTSLVYNASDVFIAPSVAETFGYVVMEALSCKTPVVAFNVGGIPDMIVHKENGYLAIPRNSNDLANGIEYCLFNKLEGGISDKFSKKNITNSHIELIHQLTGTKLLDSK